MPVAIDGLFGYNGNPSLVEVIAYPVYLAVAFWYFLALRPPQLAPQPQPRPQERAPEMVRD